MNPDKNTVIPIELILKCILTSPSFYGDPFHKLNMIVKNNANPKSKTGEKELSDDN